MDASAIERAIDSVASTLDELAEVRAHSRIVSIASFPEDCVRAFLIRDGSDVSGV
jgi:hypothetical protein